MSTIFVLLVIGLIVGVVVKTRTDRAKADQADQAEGVVAAWGQWRVTATEFLVGPRNGTCVRHPLAGLAASFEMTGAITRDSGRYTVTRFAVLGPLALAAKKGRNKKIDDREGYLTVTGGDGVAMMQIVQGRYFASAKQFQIRFNQLALAAGTATSAPVASPPAPGTDVPALPATPESAPAELPRLEGPTGDYTKRMGLRRPTGRQGAPRRP